MKMTYSILVSLLFVAVLSGCQKNFLDQTPVTSIDDAEYWTSVNDLKLFANNFYNKLLPNYNGWGSIGIYGLDADNGSDDLMKVDYNTNFNGETVVPGSGGSYGAYSDWSNLREVNYLLANYTKVPESFDVTKTYVGEALFFRAYFYFDKLKRFGALPWITIPLETMSDELFSERLPRNVIADSIINDLEKAIEYLPSKGSAEASRVNKEIAMLMQARIALYEGTWEKYHAGTAFGVEGATGNSFLEKAASRSMALIENSGGYALTNFTVDAGYWDLFNQTDYSSSSEIMLWRAFNTTLGLGHRWHRYTTSGGGRGITKDLVDAYLCTDGAPIGTSALYQGDATLISVVANRDPRLSQSMYVPDGAHIITNNRPGGLAPVMFQYPTFNLGSEAVSPTGYQIYKGHSPDYNQQQDLGTTGQIIFRFAEIYLIYAEAKAELGTFTQSDADRSINLLRSRVNMPHLTVGSIISDPNIEFPTISPLLNEIRRERRVELAMEGYRKDDLYRWAAMGTKIVGSRPKGAKRAQWEVAGTPESTLNAVLVIPVDNEGYLDYFQNVAALSAGYKFNINRDYLSPLPLDQITISKGGIQQNPGW